MASRFVRDTGKKLFAGFRSRAEREQMQQQRAMARELAKEAGTHYIDKHGQEMQVGDMVILPAITGACEWIVRKVVPAVDPGVPPGHLKVLLTSHLDVVVPGGTPMMDTLLVRKRVVRPATGAEGEQVADGTPQGAADLTSSPMEGPDATPPSQPSADQKLIVEP